MKNDPQLNDRYLQLARFSKMMCPMQRVRFPGISSDDAAIADYLTSLSEETRAMVVDYVLDGVGCCPWPAIPEPTEKEVAERADFNEKVREGFLKLFGS